MPTNLKPVNRNPALCWDDCLNGGNTKEEQYEAFKTDIMNRKFVPILIDGEVRLYRFNLSETSIGLLKKLVEIQMITEHTTLQSHTHQKCKPLIIASAKGRLKVEDFREIVTKDVLLRNNYNVRNIPAEMAFDACKQYLVAVHHEARKEEIESKLSKTLHHFCEYSDLDFLANILNEYLYDKRESFYEGLHNLHDSQREINEENFNETEKQAVEKESMVCEILKSMNIELLKSINVDETNDFELECFFHPRDKDITEGITIEPETLREFVEQYARHNADILFGSELLNVFASLQLPSEVSKKQDKTLVHTTEYKK